MTTPALLLSRLSFIGLGKEGATQGTYQAPSIYIPGQTYKPSDDITYDDDDSMQGNATKVQQVIQGIKDGSFSFDSLAYFETLGHLFVALGYADTVGTGRSVSDGADTSSTTITSATASFVQGDVGSTITGTDIPAGTTIASVTNGTTAVLSAATTGTGSSRSWVIAGGTAAYQHKFKIPAAGTQPPSYSITDFNQLTASTGTRAFVGQMLDQLGITIDVKALMKLTAAWKGWASASQSKPTPSYPSIAPGHGWENAYTFNGTVDKNVLSMGYTFKRNVETVHTGQNSQAPYVTFAGEAELDAKVKIVTLDETELLYYLNNTQPALVSTVTSPSGTVPPVLTITSTKTAWVKGATDRSGKYVTADFDVHCFYNSADGGPAQIMLQNGVSAAY